MNGVSCNVQQPVVGVINDVRAVHERTCRMCFRVFNVASAATTLRFLATHANVAHGDIGNTIDDVPTSMHDGISIDMPF